MKRQTGDTSAEETEAAESAEPKKLKIAPEEEQPAQLPAEPPEAEPPVLPPLPDVLPEGAEECLNLNGSFPLQENGSEKSNLEDLSTVAQCNSLAELSTDEFNNGEEGAVTVEDPGVAVTQQAPMLDIENAASSHLEVRPLLGHSDFVFKVVADKDLVLSCSGDTTVKVWNASVGKELLSFRGHTNAVTAIVLLTSEQSAALLQRLGMDRMARLAMSVSLDCHVKLWAIENGDELLSIYTFNGITCLAYLEGACSVALGTDGGKLELWDLKEREAKHSFLAHDDSITDLQVSESYIYSTSMDGSIRVWSYEEGELEPLYVRRRKARSVRGGLDTTQWKALALHGDLLFLGDNSCHLKVLDWRSGKMQTLRNQPLAGTADALTICGDTLLSSFYDDATDTGGINVWHLPSRSYVCTLSGPVQEIESLALTPAGEGTLRVLSGGHQLLVWDIDFSRPPSQNMSDPFHIRELEGLGVPDSGAAPSPPLSPPPPQQQQQREEGAKISRWCNLM